MFCNPKPLTDIDTKIAELLPFAISVARNVRGVHPVLSPNDLESIALEALWEAVKKCDNNRPIKPFVAICIKRSIVDHVRYWVGRNGKNGRRSAIVGTLGLHAIDSDESAFDVAAAERSPFELLSKKRRAVTIRQALSNLNDKERAIVRGFYLEEHLQKDLSKELRVSAPRVSQLDKRARRKLKECLKNL